MDLQAKEQLEIIAWRDSPTEKPEVDTVENLVNKMTDAPVFLEGYARHRALFEGAQDILELGAGQGWASCLVKKFRGGARVVATDISPYAMASVPKWERVFDVRLEGRHDCRSYAVPLPDASQDLIFAYQAAHHFVAHKRTLREVHRLLRPGGHCVYLHEPTCAAWIHAAAKKRVNGKGMPVPEDVLIHAEIGRLAREAGLGFRTEFDLSIQKRGPVELVYYSALRIVPGLRHVLPCTRDLVFTKAR